MRKSRTFSPTGWLVMSLAAGLLANLAGCGSAENPSATAGTQSSSKKAHKAPVKANSADKDMADMVAAVAASKAGPAVELKFALTSRPEVGQAMDIDVAVIPGSPPPDSVSVSFQTAEGLDIVDGAQLDKVDKPAEGAPLRHVIRILPKRDGIFAVTAVVSLDSANQSASRTFSIPVIAGEGMPEQVAKGP